MKNVKNILLYVCIGLIFPGHVFSSDLSEKEPLQNPHHATKKRHSLSEKSLSHAQEGPLRVGNAVSVLCKDSPKNSSFSIEKRTTEESSITLIPEDTCQKWYSSTLFRQEVVNLHKNLHQMPKNLLQKKMLFLEEGLENPDSSLTSLDKFLGKWILNLIASKRQEISMLSGNQLPSKSKEIGFEQLDSSNKSAIFLYLAQHAIAFPKKIGSEHLTYAQIAYGLKRVLKLEGIVPIIKAQAQVTLAYYKAKYFQEVDEQVITYRKAAQHLKQALESGQLSLSAKVNAQVLLAYYKVNFLQQGSDDIIKWQHIIVNLQDALVSELSDEDRIKVQTLLITCLLNNSNLRCTYSALELKNTLIFTQNLYDKAQAQFLLAAYKLNFPQYVDDHIITYEQAAQGLKEALLSSNLSIKHKSRAQVFLAVYRFYYPHWVNDSVVTCWDAAQGLKEALRTHHLQPVVRAVAQLHLIRFWWQDRRIESETHIRGHLAEAIQSGFLPQRDKIWANQLIREIDYKLWPGFTWNHFS